MWVAGPTAGPWLRSPRAGCTTSPGVTAFQARLTGRGVCTESHRPGSPRAPEPPGSPEARPSPSHPSQSRILRQRRPALTSRTAVLTSTSSSPAAGLSPRSLQAASAAGRWPPGRHWPRICTTSSAQMSRASSAVPFAEPRAPLECWSGSARSCLSGKRAPHRLWGRPVGISRHVGWDLRPPRAAAPCPTAAAHKWVLSGGLFVCSTTGPLGRHSKASVLCCHSGRPQPPPGCRASPAVSTLALDHEGSACTVMLPLSMQNSVPPDKHPELRWPPLKTSRHVISSREQSVR